MSMIAKPKDFKLNLSFFKCFGGLLLFSICLYSFIFLIEPGYSINPIVNLIQNNIYVKYALMFGSAILVTIALLLCLQSLFRMPICVYCDDTIEIRRYIFLHQKLNIDDVASIKKYNASNYTLKLRNNKEDYIVCERGLIANYSQSNLLVEELISYIELRIAQRNQNPQQ